jgi:hypothetical protein
MSIKTCYCNSFIKTNKFTDPKNRTEEAFIETMEDLLFENLNQRISCPQCGSALPAMEDLLAFPFAGLNLERRFDLVLQFSKEVTS